MTFETSFNKDIYNFSLKNFWNKIFSYLNKCKAIKQNVDNNLNIRGWLGPLSEYHYLLPQSENDPKCEILHYSEKSLQPVCG